jgi:hypothetical protein
MNAETPLERLFMKIRYYNLTVIFSVHSWRFDYLNFKRLCIDINIYIDYSKEDFNKMIQQTQNKLEYGPLWIEYLNLTHPHSQFVLNITVYQYHFE